MPRPGFIANNRLKLRISISDAFTLKIDLWLENKDVPSGDSSKKWIKY